MRAFLLGVAVAVAVAVAVSVVHLGPRVRALTAARDTAVTQADVARGQLRLAQAQRRADSTELAGLRRRVRVAPQPPRVVPGQPQPPETVYVADTAAVVPHEVAATIRACDALQVSCAAVAAAADSADRAWQRERRATDSLLAHLRKPLVSTEGAVALGGGTLALALLVLLVVGR